MTDPEEPKVIQSIEDLEDLEDLLNNNARVLEWRKFNYVVDFDLSRSSSPNNLNLLAKAVQSIPKLTFLRDMRFDNIGNSSLVIENATFKGKVVLEKISLSVQFISVNFHGGLGIKSCKVRDFDFLSSNASELILEENNFYGRFKISTTDSSLKKSNARKIEIEKLFLRDNTFHATPDTQAREVRFGHLNVGYFHLQGIQTPTTSEINIGDCDFKKLTIRNLRNGGKLRVYRINLNLSGSECKELILTHLYLGDSEFQNVNLNYKKACIKDNLFSGLIYTGVQWPAEIESIESEEQITDTEKRDTYRSLKNVSQQNNDTIQAVGFHAEEMRAYSKSLRRSKGKTIDKIILWLNRFTNDCGLNWVRPLVLILAIGALLYCALLWSVGMHDSSCGTSAQWKLFPVFLNPTHKSPFMCGDNWSFLTYSIDLSFRVLEGILFYQTIVAFRKFTRKV